MRAIELRRRLVIGHLNDVALPFKHYDWERVHGACCENVIGYVPIPVGVAGPLIVDGIKHYLPMATTEGALIASTSRGCKAINANGGAVTVLVADGMTRGPIVSFRNLSRAAAAKVWIETGTGQRALRKSFDQTSRFARLQTISVTVVGSRLYIRFQAKTGDAMVMNMISKGVERALETIVLAGFADMQIVSLSGNVCADKKSSAMNWIAGRGKSVAAEAFVPGHVVRSVLKTDVDSLVKLNQSKNLIGSAVAGSIGGFNAHAANIIAAMFIATGQDAAQVTESSSCLTVMDNIDGDLRIAVSMPCIETGTVGGGTILAPQASMLSVLGVQGPHITDPGRNAARLAQIMAAATLAGELSLCSALAAGHVVSAHMKHNRLEPSKA